MKTFSWSYRMAIGLSLIQLFSCQKNMKSSEETLTFQTSSEAVIYNEFNDCKLRTITHKNGGVNVPTVKGTFVYHPDGLPDRLTYDWAGTGNPNYFFIYDNKRRLRELRLSVEINITTGYFWHKYGYNNLNQIILDTLYHPEFPTHTTISQITYDNQNRVSGETIRNLHGDVTKTITYNYDSRGNLVVNGWLSSYYDNNISIFRTHPLFQFIHRNYSRNNAAAQAKYNYNGLPLSNNPSNDAFFNADPEFIGQGVTKATYDCEGNSQVNEFLYCKLRTFSYQNKQGFDVPDLTVQGTFVYHPDGLPDNLTFNTLHSYNPNYYFIYDNKRRLRELQICIMKNRPDDTGPWHRYGYNNLDQIVLDTLLNFSSFDPASASVRAISTITYDSQGRIIKEVSNGYSGTTVESTQTVTYNYDSRGNLLVNGWPDSYYDNKVSIYRAHSLFQFIHRNYSKNNSAAQPQYNSKGLPLSNVPGVGGFFGVYPPHGDDSGITKITYDCP
jgi:hypothetical protein